MKTRSEKFGVYALKAGILGGKAVARAFLEDSAAGIVMEVEAQTPDEAIEELKRKLESQAAEEAKRRRHDESLGFHVPTEREFARALAIVKPRDAKWKMLHSHALAGETGLTAGDLANLAGYPNFNSANLQYGLLGKAIAEALRIDLPKSVAREGEDVATGVLAAAGPERHGVFVWVMHPELRSAVLAELA